MGSYEVRFKTSVAKDLRGLASRDVVRILERVDGLARDPRPPGVEKLSTGDLYRVRQGRYRIVYEIFDHELVVVVIRVAHRRDVYRRQ